jgi:hypothetical protein
MMENEMKVILNTSDEAASFKTNLSGWVSRRGMFFGNDERTARWDGCTHVACECGHVVEKGRSKCEICRREASDKRFASMERKKWDGETPLYLFDDDCFFWCEDQLEDYCDEHDCRKEDLKLVICEPTYAKEIDPNEYYCEDLPEDGEIEGDLLAAFEELNSFIRGSKIILSWAPGKIAAEL